GSGIAAPSRAIVLSAQVFSPLNRNQRSRWICLLLFLLVIPRHPVITVRDLRWDDNIDLVQHRTNQPCESDRRTETDRRGYTPNSDPWGRWQQPRLRRRSVHHAVFGQAEPRGPKSDSLPRPCRRK